MTTIADVTALRAAAARHNDSEMVRLCDLVIEAGETNATETPEIAAAWDAIEEAIASARAMQDDE